MKSSKLYETMNVVDSKSILLNGNENGYNPFREEIKELSTGEIMLNRYPKDDYLKLRLAYSNYIELCEENLIAGNGSDEMINLVISRFISKNQVLVTFNPDFGMYDFYCNINQGIIKKFDIDLGNGLFSVNRFIEFVLRVKPSLIIFSNPNNPTGQFVSKSNIEEILEKCNDIIIVIDEAYIEFQNENKSVKDLVNSYRNLLVTRTLSKAWGMAALRVGFLIGNVKVISDLKNYKIPYNINSYSNYIASKLLYNIEDMRRSVDKIILERNKLFEELVKLNFENIKFFESSGNYIFGKGSGSNLLAEALLKKGIVIRNFKNNSLRITIGNKEENLEVIKAMKDIKSRW